MESFVTTVQGQLLEVIDASGIGGSYSCDMVMENQRLKVALKHFQFE